MNYETIIGLEIHAELATESKLFCSCKNEFGGEVSAHVCPGCLAFPGTLPVFNEKALRYAIMMGKAVHSEISHVSKFDRKHYFYPDLPKANQLSQYDMPICCGGYVDFLVGDEVKRCRFHHIHIEEDAAKLLHDGAAGSQVDFNRGGVPLIEMVTEPDLRSADEAKAFLEAVKSILSTLGICDCKMEEGSIRCDVNVSVRPVGQQAFGTRIEMKNINTFSGAHRAVSYESARQIKTLTQGGALTQETRRWDDDAGINMPMRSKEDAQDYRYIPDPDLPLICIDDDFIASIEIPELPMERYFRYRNDFGLSTYDSDLLANDRTRSDFFDACIAAGAAPKTAANWILGDVAKTLGARGEGLETGKLTPASLADILALIDRGEISGAAGKKVLSRICETGCSAQETVEALGLLQINDESALRALAQGVIEKNPKSESDYRSGKTAALGFLVGQCMRASGGKGNPELLGKILVSLLDAQQA